VSMEYMANSIIHEAIVMKFDKDAYVSDVSHQAKIRNSCPMWTSLQIGEMIFSRSLNICDILWLDEREMWSISDVIVYNAEAPKLDLSKLAGREIRVRAGEPIRVDVPVTGSPPPVISWQKENKALSPSDRVSLASDVACV